MVCPSETRFLLLFTFLKKNRNKKLMVFFSSCKSVKFHSELLNYIDITVLDIHVSLLFVCFFLLLFLFCFLGGRVDSGCNLCPGVCM